MTFDVERIRSEFPALGQGVAYFDGPGGSQVPSRVGDAMARTIVAGVSNRGTVTEAERRAEAAVVDARAAVADLLNADAGGVVFGRSMTQLTYDISRALAKQWGPGDEVVVTRLDHDANIRPWVQATEAVGATVRWADFDASTGELPTAAITDVLTERTRLVAVTGASNLIGARPDVSAISAAVHEAGALCYVDGVHLTPHAPVDVAELGADFFACSPYKFFGPHHGIVVADPQLLETVHPDKLLPATNEVPERFELGTLPYEVLAGTTATVDFIADMAAPNGERRARVRTSMAAAEAYEDGLFDRLRNGLDGIARVTVAARPKRHTPTVLFNIEGVPPQRIYEHLATRGVNAPSGTFYAIVASHHLGLGDEGGVRAGLAPYTNDDDVDRLLEAVAELAA